MEASSLWHNNPVTARMTSFLLSVFGQLKASYQDVLHDMGVSEECLIDGESLFLEAIVDARCPAVFSGVPLQLMYYIERFLAKLNGHGGRFRIVFFDAYGLVWRSLPEAAALRETLVAHLRRTLPFHTVQVFRCWWPTSAVQQANHRPSTQYIGQRLPVPNTYDDGDEDDDVDFIRLLVSMRPAFVLVSNLLSELPKLLASSCSTPEVNTVPIRMDDMETVRQRLMGSRGLQKVAQLSIGLLLRCLQSSSVVLLSSLDFDAATRPFGFILDVDACAASLRLHHDNFTKAVRVITEHLALGDIHQPKGAAGEQTLQSQLGKGDVVAARAIQNLHGAQSSPPPGRAPVTPRTALAAAVISSLQEEGHFQQSTESMEALLGLWVSEVFLLHAVMLDYSCLEDRALALPYGCLRGLYDVPSSSVAASGSAAAAGITSEDRDAAATPRLSLYMIRFMRRLVLPLVSDAVRSRIWDTAVIAGGSKVMSSGGPQVTMEDGDGDAAGGHPCKSWPPPSILAALADPYQGPLLHALVICLVMMRSRMGEHAFSKGERQPLSLEHQHQQIPGQRHSPNAASGAAVVPLLGLPLAASETWHTARRLAGLQILLSGAPAGSDDVTGGPEAGFGPEAQQYGFPHPCNIDEERTTPIPQGNAVDLGDLLLEHLLKSMPYSEDEAQCATAFRTLLLGPGNEDGSGGGEGFAAVLDRSAQQALVEAFHLPEPMRRSPVVRAVEQLWERVVPPPMPMTTTASMGFAASAGNHAAARTSGGGVAVPPMTRVRGWGPWAHLVAPVIQKLSRSGDRGASTSSSVLDAGHFEEVYHWHTRKPLIPAFLMQADSREAARQRILRHVAAAPNDAVLERFLRFMAHPYRGRAIRLMNSEKHNGGMLKALVMEGVRAYYGLEEQKEERALRRLIDSMQGDVTFFRSGAGVGAASMAVAITSVQQLVISSLDEIHSIAHLEAIRQDRQGKVALTELLRDSKMSAADMKRRLAKLEDVREAERRRAAERQGSILRGDAARWNETVVPHLIKMADLGTTQMDEALKAMQRFCSNTATLPEFRIIAAVLQLQLHMKSLYAVMKTVDKRNCTGSGNTGTGGSARGRTEVADEGPVLGSLLPTFVEARHGGDVPLEMQRALATVLESLAGFKKLCRAGGRQALWVQPCPLLDEPRVAAPCLVIACAALQALGFGEAAERLHKEAGWHDESHLLDQAKVMDARLSALLKLAGASDAPSGGGSRASSCVKTKTGRTGVATASGKGAASKIGSSSDEVSPLEVAVDDAMLIMYCKIRDNDIGFKPLPLGISLVRFQLRCMGDRLERLASGVPDPRVAFIPDHWQRRLLDIVDEGGSAVVSAPTSSGKTFISSYVIRKVLDAHRGRGRVVIVVPTKVLVLQINAQIAKDFHDVRDLPDGTVVQGTFTRDFRHNYMNCVALVTVPQCIEILFMSPAHREWVASLKYVIFDEVQCITELDMGEFWERSILATRCPFLALSATIGNPEVFTEWLRRVKEIQKLHDGEMAAAAHVASGRQVSTTGSQGQQSASYDVHLIVHKERYNDLTSSIFLPSLESVRTSGAWRMADDEDKEYLLDAPAIQQVGGPGKAGDGCHLFGSILPIHPLISVDLDRVSHAGDLPPELAMTPEEMLQLYDGMVWQASAIRSSASVRVAAESADGGHAKGGSTAAALAAVAASVQQRLARLDPDRLFAPLDPINMPDLDPGVMSYLNTMHGGPGTGSSAEAPPGNSGACTTAPSSLVIRDRVKAWEKRLLLEVLMWACSSPRLEDSPYAGIAASPAGAAADIGAMPSAAPTCCQPATREGLGDEEVSGSTKQPQKAHARPDSSFVRLYGPWKECLIAIRKRLEADMCERHAEVQSAWARAHSGRPGTSIPFLYYNLPSLIRTLHRQQKLPAILFNFSRKGIVLMCKTIVKHLEAVQRHYRKQYAQQLGCAIARKAAAASTSANVLAACGSLKSSNKAAAVMAEAQAGGVSAPQSRTQLIDGLTFSLHQSRPDPSFSLIPFAHMDDERLLEAVDELGSCVNPLLVRALEFGVGVHHGGLNKRYRTAVETLFRAKILQVVIATGTLAMGVHMPCRTVVMAGDSTHLDALSFRQMSGRSGRRGLDTLGHVVFYGLPLHRVHRLRTSPMPRLHGQMLVTPTTTLRLLLLEEQLRLRSGDRGDNDRDDDKPTRMAGVTKAGNVRIGSPAVDLILKMLTEPFMATLDDPSSTCRLNTLAPVMQPLPSPSPSPSPVDSTRRQLMRHTFGLSLMYLLRYRLVDPATGRPRGLAGLATHLFWTEPANFVLCRLLQEGVFARMCKRHRGQELKNAAVLLLSHIFLRVPLSPNLETLVRSGAFSGTTSSVVQLPPMLPEAADCIQRYNQESFAAAVGYVIQFVIKQMAAAGEMPLRLESRLPLSGLVIKAADGSDERPLSSGTCADHTSATGYCLRRLLSRMQRHVVACSPFMALGGRGDEFESVSEMLTCVRQGVELQSKAIPVLELRRRQGGSEPALNAWLYDFFKVHSDVPLIRDNQIREGDMWDMLKSAQGVLNATALALELAVEAAAAAVTDTPTGAQPTINEEELEDYGIDFTPEGQQRHAPSSAAGASEATGCESLEADLERLQSLPRNHSPGKETLHSAQMVARLFRLIAQDFSAGFRSVGA
ncbi:hypothetical protein VaNZ11_009317 [Volvox africanus]|uniref:DEAD/DEAH box helicase n=1 Tax=Volvox africanus TaxID=51714 RepID=A0ABQ5S958_9CHLO|nr:hypothetical protein VaNZ11_009317 [Volvox africanus]